MWYFLKIKNKNRKYSTLGGMEDACCKIVITGDLGMLGELERFSGNLLDALENVSKHLTSPKGQRHPSSFKRFSPTS